MMHYEEVRARWKFELPDDYRRFVEGELLDNSPTRGLYFSRFNWLSPLEIADVKDMGLAIPNLIPFARTLERGHYCWFAEQQSDPWVAECPRDSHFAEGFAPSFTGFIYRAFLEELADTWLDRTLRVSPDEVRSLIQGYIEQASLLLPSHWAQTLRGLARNPIRPTPWQTSQLIQGEEAKSIIARDLAFKMLNKPFRQHQQL